MKKKFWLVLSISAIAAVFLEMLAWLVTPASIANAILPQNLENLYSTGEYYLSGYDYSDSIYIPNNNDPQIGFYFSGRDIKTIFIEFERPLRQDVAIQVYYATNNEALNEVNQEGVIAQKGEHTIVVPLPYNTYTHIRLDINGEFSLRGIYTDTSEPEIVYKKSPVEMGRFFCGWVALSIIGMLCYSTSNIDACLGLKKYKIKKKWVICAVFCIFTVLLLLQVNFSNMASYNAVIPNNIKASGALAIGTTRSIRSDEFLVGTPAFFHNIINGKLSVQAITEDSNSIIVSLNNTITKKNPYYWGELYLPASYAFSWNALVKIFFALYTFYRMFHIITANRSFSILASFMLALSPGFQWWWGSFTCGVWCGFVVFFYDFFCTTMIWKKILCAWGLVCCASAIVPSLYPAWDVPRIYLFLLILIGIYATEKRINFEKTDVIYIVVTCSLMAIVVAAYFISSGDTTQVMLETVYPGKRFSSGGGLVESYWAHYLVAPFTPWQSDNIFLNKSEISHFLHLFPVPVVVYFLKYREFKRVKVVTCLICFNIFCDIYMIFGVGEIIAKYTLLSYTTPERLHSIWGISSFLLLLLECYYIIPKQEEKFSKGDWVRLLFLNGSMIAFLTWVAVRQTLLIDYIGIGNYVYVSSGVILLGNLLLFGKKRIFISIMCILTIISGVVINPINFGTGIISDTPLAKEIREIDKRDSGRWIALDDVWMPKYVYAQGVDCLNYLSWPPRFDLFEPLDEDGKFRDIYNRYAHVMVDFTEEETSFLLNQMDALTVNLNIDDLKKWDVNYVVTRKEILQDTENIQFEMLYHDSLDNVNIYKVNYYIK